ncbi:MAG TPA: cell wall-binding repeat-containing protein, partial [Acidothermaceae bacterium]
MHRRLIAASLSAAAAALFLGVSGTALASPTVVRYAGADRYATSAAMVDANYAPGVPVAYIATGLNFPDALAGGAAAANQGGPLLLTDPNAIPDAVGAELRRLTPARIVVLGGLSSVSASVATALAAYTTGTVTRVSGTDRYATAALLAGTFPSGSPVYVATGLDFPDALAATAAAAAQHAAILLTDPSTLVGATAQALAALHPASITIVGSTTAVSAAVQTQLGTYSTEVRRLSGSDRYSTAAAIAAVEFPSATGVFLASGAGFADALTGGPVAGSHDQPLLLASDTCLPTPTSNEITALGVTTETLLGGPATLSSGVAALTSCPASAAPSAPSAPESPPSTPSSPPKTGSVPVYNFGANVNPSSYPGASLTPDTPDGDGWPARECTAYVVWWLDQHDVEIHASTLIGPAGSHTLGNAGGWDAAAKAVGWAITATPVVGAVAQWHDNESTSD